MSVTPGQSMGPYTISRELGRGGMGVVYLARDTRLDRDVAIKALPEHLGHDPDRLARFEREAKTLAQLNHPNVAGIYGVEEHEGARYLVLEYVTGETLTARLDRGALPVEEALEIAVQMAAGVEAAHEAGVIHRDLKPGNVIVTPDGKAKVLDFGLARAHEASSSTSASPTDPTVTSPAKHSPTMPGAILGTAAYMSPEQARGRNVDKRSDIWSFGVVLYEMLTGANPFAGETVTDTLGAVLHREPDLGVLPPDTPSAVSLLLRQSLAKDRQRRLHDIADARLLLESAIADPLSGAAIGGYRVRSRPRGAVLPVVAVVAFVAGLLAMQAWLATRTRTPDRPSLPVAFEIDVSPLGSLTLPESSADIAISPDGRYIAFEYQVREGYRVGLRDLASNELLWRETMIGGGPFFSPDGRQLGFQDGRRLSRVSLAGGPAMEICNPDVNVRGRVAWLDSHQIVYSSGSHLYIVDARGGEPRILAESDREIQHENRSKPIIGFEHVCAMPDGRGILSSTWHDDVMMAYDIVHVALDTGKVTHVIERGAQPAVLADEFVIFLRESSLFGVRFDFDRLGPIGEPEVVLEGVRTGMDGDVGQFEVSPEGTLAYVPGRRIVENRRLIRVTRAGAVELLGAPDDFSGYLQVSHDGRLVATVTARRREHVALFEIATGAMSRISSGPGAYADPLLSPDGTQIAYMAWEAQARTAKLMVQSLAMIEEPRELIADAMGMSPKAWSPDGRYILLAKRRELLVLDLQSDEGPQPIEGFPPVPRNMQFSPDGNWIAFRTRFTGESNVLVSRFPYDKKTWRVSRTGGYRPRWSRDGKEIFFIKDRHMYAAPFSVDESGAPVIGEPQELFDATGISSMVWGVVYDVTPEGDFIMIAPAEPEIDARLNVIVNWGDVVRRKLSRTGVTD